MRYLPPLLVFALILVPWLLIVRRTPKLRGTSLGYALGFGLLITTMAVVFWFQWHEKLEGLGGQFAFASTWFVIVVQHEFWTPEWSKECVRHIDTPAPQALSNLAPPGIPVLELDGSHLQNDTDLARALDQALGPFAWPEDPAQKIEAHLAHERRNGGRILVWRDAGVFAAAQPQRFAAFVAEWRRSGGSARLLVLDLPEANAAANAS